MKKTNLSWVGALLVFALLLWCTAATPGTIADPASYAPAVYSSMLSLLPPVVAIVEGRKLVFKVSLHDEKGPVGGGVHERFIINNAKFAAKAEAKKG